MLPHRRILPHATTLSSPLSPHPPGGHGGGDGSDDGLDLFENHGSPPFNDAGDFVLGDDSSDDGSVSPPPARQSASRGVLETILQYSSGDDGNDNGASDGEEKEEEGLEKTVGASSGGGSSSAAAHTPVAILQDLSQPGEPSLLVSAGDFQETGEELAGLLVAYRGEVEPHKNDKVRSLRRSGAQNLLKHNRTHAAKEAHEKSNTKKGCQTPPSKIIEAFLTGKLVYVHAYLTVPPDEQKKWSKQEKQKRPKVQVLIQVGPEDLCVDPSTGLVKCSLCGTLFTNPKAAVIAGAWACGTVARADLQLSLRRAYPEPEAHEGEGRRCRHGGGERQHAHHDARAERGRLHASWGAEEHAPVSVRTLTRLTCPHSPFSCDSCPPVAAPPPREPPILPPPTPFTGIAW